MNTLKFNHLPRAVFALVGATCLSLGGTVLLSLSSLAQTTVPAPGSSPGNLPGGVPLPGGVTNPALSPADQQFMIQAAQSDQFEIQSSQLALKRGSSPAVKDYAQRMIKEHTNSSQQLQQIAKQYGVTLPKDVGAENQPVLEKLSQLSGAEFDRSYMQAQVQAHAKTESRFKQYLQQGQNPQLKNFANQVLPVITAHLNTAQSMVATRQ
uniref:Outer membrane protein n=1 Tax=Cyanothece sp. (strain PCC 7425 / ATCC 29141) TaxID=395961 RepID=B8HVN4_CYAP4